MTPLHGEPVIVATAVGPGHDGRAELVVELGYPNGGRTQLSITQEALVGALDAAGVTRAEDLLGRPWTVLVGHDTPPEPATATTSTER
jgi:hypothetical protein